MKPIDFRSDTITQPTPVMREAMAHAQVGDDVYMEDPTLTALEDLAAEMTGKEKALFVPSGTMGNQIAVNVFTDHGNEVILEENCHIFTYEAGGIGAISGVQSRLIPSNKGVLSVETIEKAVRGVDIHYPETALICLENTHNKAGGTVTDVPTMKAIYEFAQHKNIPVHLDGARIFNAATALGVPVSELTQYTDSVMFCLSKGLCAPVGSMLAGTEDFIDRARKVRKMLGGGIRQGGILAAAGIIALQEMTGRLEEDHRHAKVLAQGLNAMDGLSVDVDFVQTNILMCDVTDEEVDLEDLMKQAREEGVLVNAMGARRLRFVTHYYITEEDIHKTLEVFAKIMKKS
ncbi:low-specificity L-threonine aldolase [Alkalibacter rhizosphaerae]|uniref:Low-specificity L-threonine aldolase n=1 Tax=Alkalibacter rhizosphaerae TaxID=2815577 RepID=A0A975AIH2_9FIRM|nr:low-specificity L-threonine aldolase [Alkalibacter rhizosphaerae]QSX08679.1 low-specificity L-threonine aldolase [Alkalibacter rhizosphaerae]